MEGPGIGVIGSSTAPLSDPAACSTGCDGAAGSCKLLKINAQIAAAQRR
jgi:hypothetical protein